MLYFNGFSLKGEEKFFIDSLLINESEHLVVGFSYGAQKALEYVYHTKKRVDRLILLSPAFFHIEKPSFIRTQLHYFEVGKEAYIQKFLKNTLFPSKANLTPFLQAGTKEELKALLEYQWDVCKLAHILENGTIIEVFLGEKDQIIPSVSAYHFFEPVVTKTYWIKNVGHLLLDK